MTTADAPRPRKAARDLGLAGVLAVGLGVALFFWFRAGPPPEGSATRPVVVRATMAERLVGDRACAECHPGEAALHARSGHARTLGSAASSRVAAALADRTFPDPEFPDSTWSYRMTDGRFEVEWKRGEDTEVFPVDFAFGSDTHATTFVSILLDEHDHPLVFEHRLTHFAEGDRMGVTPGQEATSALTGRVHQGRHAGEREAVHCFGCHATLTSAEGKQRFVQAELVPNVSCESCHGPGREHIAAVRAGARPSDLRIDFGVGRYKTDVQMRLCGQCHRHPDMAPAGSIRPDNHEIVRFQPVGLMQSACYTKSAGALSCATCHDPHAKVSADLATYDAACLKCHQGPGKRPCPVSAARDCVSCHMPRVDAGQGIAFADHWVRVREPGPRRTSR